MGTKLYIFFVSLFINYLSNNFMPLDWQIFELKIYCLTLGVCWGYNIWLLWNDQEKIIIGITTLYQFKKQNK